ncbi:TPA: hypothetical protein ACHG5Z_004807, partial [Escherichia coli]|nr:hypothetical protein [Escherichia coli]MED0255789.1 hypothetical protein [Escherichia coli]
IYVQPYILAECQSYRIIDGNRKLSGIPGMVVQCWQVMHISVHSTGKRRAGFPEVYLAEEIIISLFPPLRGASQVRGTTQHIVK